MGLLRRAMAIVDNHMSHQVRIFGVSGFVERIYLDNKCPLPVLQPS